MRGIGQLSLVATQMHKDYLIHGLAIRIEYEGRLAERWAGGLLPAAQLADVEAPGCRFRLLGEEGVLSLEQEGVSLIQGQNPEVVAHYLRARLLEEIAARAQVRLALHGGAVGWHGRAFIFPAQRLTGTTRLIQELVRQGAVHYSDGLILLDDSLQVLAFQGDPLADPQLPPLPVGSVVRVPFTGQPSLELVTETTGQAALNMMSRAFIRGEDGPAQALSAISSLTTQAHCLGGTRGEAAACAQALLAG